MGRGKTATGRAGFLLLDELDVRAEHSVTYALWFASHSQIP